MQIPVKARLLLIFVGIWVTALCTLPFAAKPFYDWLRPTPTMTCPAGCNCPPDAVYGKFSVIKCGLLTWDGVKWVKEPTK